MTALTIREIAERAGVSEGALYRHYASKEELACSIFLTHLQQLTGELDPAYLDKLLAPVALYPDQLLAQMLLCSGNRGRSAS